MTLGEITLTCKAFQKKEERRADEIIHIVYGIASMTANFITCKLNGEPIPTINKMLNKPEPKPAITEDEQKLNVYRIRDMFVEFANNANKQRHKKVGEGK